MLVALLAALPASTAGPARAGAPRAAAARYATPPGIFTTANYREATALSDDIAALRARGAPQRVAIIGGGLSGLATAKYLADAGHIPTVYEARRVLGGKVSAWQDADGDWVETGLHIFFGAYPNMMRLFSELGLHERLHWKAHRMAFALRERPGEFTSFEFTPGVPAPFGMALAILRNTQMLSWGEKLAMVPALLPMLLGGQEFIDAQDDLSVTAFMRKHAMPERINEEIFIAMGKALDFIDPDKLSMAVVLTAMNRFIREADGSQTAFLDGNQPERLCEPLAHHVRAAGGAVRLGCAVRQIELEPDGSRVAALVLDGGERVVADAYVSAAPVDVFKRLLPRAWLAPSAPSAVRAFFAGISPLRGIGVINVQLWLDRRLPSSLDGLAFSRSPLLSVYADMAKSCAEYADPLGRSCLELVIAPVTAEAGSAVDWLKRSDEQIVDAALLELARLFPDEIAPDARAPLGGSARGADDGRARVRKFAVVRVPRSVYAALPGMGAYRPSQETPVPNFVLAGDWTRQRYLGSMEGAVLAGKLAAQVVARRAAGVPTAGVRAPAPAPLGARGEEGDEPPDGGPLAGRSPVAFGGGQMGGLVHV
ncbi:hypothetical protein KFE25_005655 [Diacronema lutheri]|uniref:Amine oxidase n=2 Tax=Diacronema lutheri TaxID=2081491 RepID=A0A8J6CDP4_DIALT|nr:hypothetical protein KFE25_005655 [Diacronema lutheri]